MSRALLLKRFKEVGLSLYEAKSYLSLLEKDTLTVTEVSKIAGIPRTNAYEALEKLLARGLCVSRPGNTKRYGASDPASIKDKFLSQMDHVMEIELANLANKENEIIAKYKSAKESKLIELNKKEKDILEKYNAAKEAKLIELNKREKKISEENKTAKENINQIIEELKPQYKDSRANVDPLDFIEIIKDSQQIHKKFIQLNDEAKKEVLIFSKPPYSGPRKKLEEQADRQAKPLRRGIKIRTIYELPWNQQEMEWTFNILKEQVERGENARVIKRLPMKMAIFDMKIVLLAMKDPVSTGTTFTTQVVRHTDLAEGLTILFNHIWEQAEDYHIMGDLLKKM